MPLPKSFALAEGSWALTGDEHAKAANKMNLAAARELRFCSRRPRCLSDEFGGGGRLQIPLIEPIRPGITGFCKPQDGQADNNYLLLVAQGPGSPA